VFSHNFFFFFFLYFLFLSYLLHIVANKETYYAYVTAKLYEETFCRTENKQDNRFRAQRSSNPKIGSGIPRHSLHPLP